MTEHTPHLKFSDQHPRTRLALLIAGIAACGAATSVAVVYGGSYIDSKSGSVILEGTVTNKLTDETFEIAGCKDKPALEAVDCATTVRTGSENHCNGPKPDFAKEVAVGDIIQERRHRNDQNSAAEQYCTWHIIGTTAVTVPSTPPTANAE